MAGPNVGRTLETGAILGALTGALALTGLLLSPTVGALLPGSAAFAAAFGSTLYVVHMACAALLVAFTGWHLLPLRHQLRAKPGLSWAMRAVSYSLLALVLVEVATGLALWLHFYDVLDKRAAVAVHLGVTFLLLAPLLVHGARGLRVWRQRRAARALALAAAHEAGRGREAFDAQRALTRRAFLRLSAYAVAGVALASAFARYTSGQISAWRLNSVGATPRLTKEGYRLRVTGLVNSPVELTFDDLLRMPARTVRMTHHCVEGWTYTDVFTGVALRDVLARAGGVKPGAAQFIFKSPEVSRQFHGRGQLYTTNFPATDGMEDETMLVYAVQGEDLPPEHGFPVRLMSPHKWGYKACKWLTEIEVTADASYRGYWEQRGYHNDGDRPGPIFA